MKLFTKDPTIDFEEALQVILIFHIFYYIKDKELRFLSNSGSMMNYLADWKIRAF